MVINKRKKLNKMKCEQEKTIIHKDTFVLHTSLVGG